MPAISFVHNAGDCGDIGINIAQGMGRQSEKLSAGFQNLSKGFDLIGNGGDHQVWIYSANLFGIGGP